MTKTILLGSVIAAVLVIGIITIPAMAGVDPPLIQAGGGDPKVIDETPRVFNPDGDDIIDRIIIKTDGRISTSGSQGLIGYAIITDKTGDTGVAVAATSHAGFFDNIGAGSGPGDEDNCENEALATGMLPGFVYNTELENCTFKILCDQEEPSDGVPDNCGPQWHLHYSTVAEDVELCPGGFKITSLSYTQPGNLYVQGNKLIISNLDTTPGPMVSVFGTDEIGTGGSLDFGSVLPEEFAAVQILATVDTDDGSLQAACLNPVLDDDDDDDDDEDDD